MFAETCSGDCYVDWVLGSPSNYDNAYFEVQSVRVYESGANDVIIASSATRQRATDWSALIIAFGSAVLTTVVLQLGLSNAW